MATGHKLDPFVPDMITFIPLDSDEVSFSILNICWRVWYQSSIAGGAGFHHLLVGVLPSAQTLLGHFPQADRLLSACYSSSAEENTLRFQLQTVTIPTL